MTLLFGFAPFILFACFRGFPPIWRCGWLCRRLCRHHPRFRGRPLVEASGRHQPCLVRASGADPRLRRAGAFARRRPHYRGSGAAAWRSWCPSSAAGLSRCNMPAGIRTSSALAAGRLPAVSTSIISLVWAISFALMTLADGAVAFLSLPFYVGIARQRGGADRRRHLHASLSRAGGGTAVALVSARQRLARPAQENRP